MKYGYVNEEIAAGMSLPCINMAQTAVNIERLIDNSKLSVRQLQRILGFSTANAIYKWKNGVTMPSIDNLVILSRLFGVSLDEIIAVDEPQNLNVSAQFMLKFIERIEMRLSI